MAIELDEVRELILEALPGAEVERGKPQGRPRVKFCRVDEMIAVAAREADPVAG